MTRYARGNKGNHRRPHDVTPWTGPEEQGTSQNQQKGTRQNNRPSSSKKQELNKNMLKAKHKHKKGNRRDKHDTFLEEHPQIVIDSKMLKKEDSSSLDSSRRLALSHEDDSVDGAELVKSGWKKDRRREERKLKRISNKKNNMVCYHCREAGHGIADCPKMLLDEEQGTGICFRCGSTEHEANKCTAKVDPAVGDFPFAKCFICQESGHLARSCPDNPRGLYPLGGGCKHCGSVEHKNQHCPHSTDTRKQSETTTLPTLRETLNWSADAEIDEIKSRPMAVRPVKKKTPKVVKF